MEEVNGTMARSCKLKSHNACGILAWPWGSPLDVKCTSAVSAPLRWLQYGPVLDRFKYISNTRFTIIALN